MVEVTVFEWPFLQALLCLLRFHLRPMSVIPLLSRNLRVHIHFGFFSFDQFLFEFLEILFGGSKATLILICYFLRGA